MIVGSGQLSVPVLQAGEKHVLNLNDGPWSSLLGHREGSSIYITILARLRTSERWSGAGHTVASNQIVIAEEKYEIFQVTIHQFNE